MNEQSSIDQNAIEAARLAQTRQRLIENKHCRQKAVALFSLQTAHMAQALKQLVDMHEMGGSTETFQEVADDLEMRIRQCHRDLFGVELADLESKRDEAVAKARRNEAVNIANLRRDAEELRAIGRIEEAAILEAIIAIRFIGAGRQSGSGGE